MLSLLLPKTYERLTQNGASPGQQSNIEASDRQVTVAFVQNLIRLVQPTMGEPDGHASLKQQVEDKVSQISQVIHAALRPLPKQTGDGSYLPEDKTELGIFSDLKHLGIRDIETLIDLVRSGASKALTNDKDLLMERIIKVFSVH